MSTTHAAPYRIRAMASVYFTSGNRILCLYRIGSRVVDRQYVGAAGGHFEPEEISDPTRCVLRELKEELGLTPEDISHLQLRYLTCRLKDHEIRQNYYYFAQLQDETLPLASNEGTLHWFTFEELAPLPMPASAKAALLHYIREGRYTDRLYAAITSETPVRFIPLH